MHTLRHRVALRTIGRRFSFLVTKDFLQLLHNLIFELRALIGMECLGWSEDIKYLSTRAFAMVCSLLPGSGSCNQRLPAAASQLYFRTPGLDRNGVPRVVRRYQIFFDKSFRNGLLFIVWKCDEHSQSSEMVDGS